MPKATIETDTHTLPVSVFEAIDYLFQKLYESDCSGSYQVKEDELRAVMKALNASDVETDRYLELASNALAEWIQFKKEQPGPFPVPFP